MLTGMRRARVPMGRWCSTALGLSSMSRATRSRHSYSAANTRWDFADACRVTDRHTDTMQGGSEGGVHAEAW